MKKYFRKSAKILLWTIASVIALFLLLVLLFQIPYVQNKIKDKAVTYLEGKIHTKVTIGRIEIGLPKKIILENVYVESQEKDTLLYGDKLAVNINLFQLINNQVDINSIDLKGITANIKRNKDSVFNFDYIIKAFASKEKPKPDSKPMTISIDEVSLDKIKVKFEDAITRNDLNFYFNHFNTKIEKFDVDNLDFEIPKIKLDGLNLKLKQGQLVEEIAENTAEVVDSLSRNSNIKLKFGEIALSKINIGYDNAGTQLNTGLKLEKMLVRMNVFDLQKQIIDIESLEIDDMKSGLTIGKFKTVRKTAVADSETNTTSNNWKIKVNQADLKLIDFRFDDENAARLKKGIDYKHLDLKDFNLDGEQFSYTADVISGKIYAFKARDKSGLNIQSLKTEFYYGPKSAYAKKLYLKTPQTLLKDQIIIGYPSIASLTKNIGAMDINASLIGSKVGFKDVLIFAPELANTNPFKSNPNAIMTINGKVIGKLNNIKIANLEVSGIGDTRVAASGKITGLPDMKKAYFDLNIKNLVSTAKDINQFVPSGSIPNTIQLPSQLAAKGTFKGTINDFFTNLSLTSSYGAATVKGNFDQTRKNYEKYQADAELTNFDIGKLIKNKELGKVTLKAKVNGTGFNPKTANATVDGKIASAQYNKYTYRNANLKGNIKSGTYNATIVMNDPNLAFDLVTNGSFKDKYPAVKLKMNVDIADLEKLNLHAGPLKLKGQIDADIPTADPDYLNGTINLHHMKIANVKGEFILDTINIIATATPEKNEIAVKSEFLDANVTGKYNLTQIADAISNSIAKYYDYDPSAKKIKTEPQQLVFTLTVKNTPVVMQLVPELKGLEPLSITGRYNSVNDSIVLDGKIPKLIYNDITISNAIIKVDTKEEALVYNIEVDNIVNPQMNLPYTNLSGTVKDNIANYTLQLKDIKDKERYLIAGNLKASGNNTEIKLNDNLVLNYDSWKMDADNLLRFGKSGIYANAVDLSKDGSAIHIQSQSEKPNAPIAVDFKDFKIETITSIVQKDSLVMGGRINGNALLTNLTKSPVFTADLEIADFSFKTDTVGSLNIKVNNEIANTYKANVILTGQGNQVNLDGFYKTGTGNFDMDLDMQKLNLKSIQGFSMGNITESSGFLSGQFKIKGTAKEPKVNGDLQFNDIAFRVKQLNSYFKSMNDKVVINDSGILFDNFTISDEEDNILIVDGKMTTNNFMDYGLNLAINADNFRAMDSKAKDNDLYYGKLYLDTRLQVTGDLSKPIVEGNIKVKKGTDLTVILPQDDPSVADREGIVEFIDQDHPELNKTIVLDSISNTRFRGIEASVNIEIDKEAELSLVIDKGNGDYLKLKGEGQLNGGIDPSGKTTLTGRYEFTGGSYEMTFNLIKRKFDIKEGSYILWTGEPTTADINITAVYKTDAAPIDLLGDQLGDMTPEIRNTYKQKIPFETNLVMKGDLMKPEITFDIILPEGNNTVAAEIITGTQTKLAQLRQQPSELNKQVFALLLLNRFIGENPFASEAGGITAESIARQSASKILSQQLNNLAGDLIKGVDLNFDLNSSDDYTSGQQQSKTDLSVGVTKQLLNDRLKVTVGSTFGLEGQQQANQAANTIADDISLEYQLSKDGRYRVRAYRKNQYQVALQGQIIETGVAFIITMNYNKFRELFQKAKTEKSQLKKKVPAPKKK
ncbi:translocation/assembly module TamB domain-containing protein [Flavobacterium sp.]|uniref:translocation/assembly module TamB domain-containing protein n=1 Tax=Flavobacterium sp. TaxID=239 RepID=UPI002B4B47F3|nr:translocation/assembly module TamB domain-containing protein [Flavobacterium sp.]HLF52898.1 translocation/assembly module TamB domain-containing protein [Flavobacterium sp.]